MAWTYAAGTATPGVVGLVDFPSLRLNQNGVGGFRLLSFPPFTQTPPVKFVATPVPRGGSIMSDPTFDVWEFNITGSFEAAVADIPTVIDYLKAHVNSFKGAIGVALNRAGWAATRSMTLKVAGQVSVEDPADPAKLKIPRRGFTIPVLAEDPIQYASALTTTPVTSSTAVPNAGNADVPYIARFDGANTTYIQVVDGLGNRVGLQYALSGGQWAEINTRDGSITTNAGVDLYQYVTIDDAVRKLPPGGLTLSKASGSGGTASVKAYDGYI